MPSFLIGKVEEYYPLGRVVVGMKSIRVCKVLGREPGTRLHTCWSLISYYYNRVIIGKSINMKIFDVCVCALHFFTDGLDD